MSEQNPNESSFTPPPPPEKDNFVPPQPPTNDSPFEPRTLVEKTEYVNKNVIWALGMSIFSLVCCGFIGFYSFGLANNLVQTIDYYDVARDKEEWLQLQKSSQSSLPCFG
jgi:hypothetical protein